MKIGVALSGGGVRGISHLGVLKALQEKGVVISKITGTSAGAIAGALFAGGISPDEILKMVLSVKYFQYIRPAMSKSGLLKIEVLQQLLEKYLPVKSFEELRVPLEINATLIKTAQPQFFSTGPLIPPILASSAIPVLFKPVKLDQNLYVDGGIVNNLPVEPLIEHCDRIIGVLCNPIDDNFNQSNFKSLTERVLLIAINTNTYTRREQCHLVLEPPALKKISVFNFSRAREIFEIGYQHTMDLFPLIEQKILK